MRGLVLFWSKATRDLLKSFGWGIRALHQLVAATMVPQAIENILPQMLQMLQAARENDLVGEDTFWFGKA